MTDYEHIAQHYVSLSKDPGFRDYLLGNEEGIGRLDELDKQEMFKGIKADVFQRIRLEKEKNGSSK